MSDNKKIRRRLRCPECGSLDVIKWGVRNGVQRHKASEAAFGLSVDRPTHGSGVRWKAGKPSPCCHAENNSAHESRFRGVLGRAYVASTPSHRWIFHALMPCSPFGDILLCQSLFGLQTGCITFPVPNIIADMKCLLFRFTKIYALM